jgi:hypothetical protein
MSKPWLRARSPCDPGRGGGVPMKKWLRTWLAEVGRNPNDRCWDSHRRSTPADFAALYTTFRRRQSAHRETEPAVAVPTTTAIHCEKTEQRTRGPDGPLSPVRGGDLSITSTDSKALNGTRSAPCGRSVSRVPPANPAQVFEETRILPRPMTAARNACSSSRTIALFAR